MIEGAAAVLERERVADRVELKRETSSKLSLAVLTYMMKFIIHDWDDERALKILRNINKVLPVGGRLLIIKMVVPEGNEPHFSKIQDLEMLVSPGGAERTHGEYRELLSRAGFELKRVIH